MGNDTILKVENLKTSFTRVTGKNSKTNLVLNNVSLELHAGEIIGVVGESGSGKSMTMLSIMQLLPDMGKVESGKISLDHSDVDLANAVGTEEMRKIRGGRIGMIFQEPMTSLNPVLTVGEQIRENIEEHCGLDKESAKKKAIEMMSMVGIADPEIRYSEYPMQFSGGMRQRIMIAMVLAAEPDVLIADEATTALDVTTQAQILEIIKELSEKTGVAVVIVTHNLGIVARYAHRIYVMYAGSIVEEGLTDEIFYSSEHPYTMSLLKAIPRLDDPKDRVLVPIKGLPPTAREFNHCPFLPRCPFRGPICKEKGIPELKDHSSTHKSACHLSAEMKIHKRTQFEEQELDKRPEKFIQDEVCLEVNHLCKSFDIRRGLMQKKVGTLKAIDDISFKVRRGETVGIVGESGCGKTSLARTIMRMYTPERGEIKLFGTDIAKLSARQLVPFRKRMTMVFQDPYSSLNPRMNAGDLVAEPMKIHGMLKDPIQMKSKVDELFSMVGLDPNLEDRLPHEFSGGQRQRICVARALASDPDVIFLDEPISALDVSIQAQLINLLESIQAKLGLAYVFIAHDLAVVKHISDKIIVMYLGRVMETARSEDIYTNPMHPYTQTLLSAVPIPDPRVESEREYEELEGEIPSTLKRPEGCPFSTRCKYADERCRKQIPPLMNVGDDHEVACFKVKKVMKGE